MTFSNQRTWGPVNAYLTSGTVINIIKLFDLAVKMVKINLGSSFNYDKPKGSKLHSNKNIIMSSFKSSRDIQKKEGGPDSCFG